MDDRFSFEPCVFPSTYADLYEFPQEWFFIEEARQKRLLDDVTYNHLQELQELEEEYSRFVNCESRRHQLALADVTEDYRQKLLTAREEAMIYETYIDECAARGDAS